ncbi:HIT domain protein [Vibrio mangrovi]|nr:HIT domain protein [Vibrio mangrovi]
MDFELHPQLQQDTTLLGNFPLSLVLLHRDQAVPWIILVPKRSGITEFHHLPMVDQQQFLIESQWVCQVLESQYQPDKINLGALGNMVPQLHYHHIARFTHDEAWPGPVWGNTSGVHRNDAEQQRIAQSLITALSEAEIFTPA